MRKVEESNPCTFYRPSVFKTVPLPALATFRMRKSVYSKHTLLEQSVQQTVIATRLFRLPLVGADGIEPPTCAGQQIYSLPPNHSSITPICTPDGIRTHTCTDFKSVISAVGLQGYMYHKSDSNRHLIVPKTIASAVGLLWLKQKAPI